MKKVLLLAVVASCFGINAQNQRFEQLPTAKRFITLNEPVSLSKVQATLSEVYQLSNYDQLTPLKAESDELGYTHQSYQQYYKGIKVEGAIVKTHVKAGQLISLTGYYSPIEALDVNPTVSMANGLKSAKAFVKLHHGTNDLSEEGQSELVVLTDPDGMSAPRVAYKFDLHGDAPLFKGEVLVDAKTGKAIRIHTHIHHQDVAATGDSKYNGQVNITANKAGKTYELTQTAQGIETYSMSNGTNYLNAVDVTSSSSHFSADDVAVQAHWGAEKTHTYFKNKHGRNSYDNSGSAIKSYVHYSSNYANAFWDGSKMTYGDGDGVNYDAMVSLDIVAHEIAHGVTEYSANLVYEKEPGALNESFSDIFGEAIEHYANGTNDWLMGDQIGIGGSGAIRSMKNPNAYGNPDTYGGTNWYNTNCGVPSNANDYCGVHINSGVQNKWFYILVTGESGINDAGNNYSVTGIGMDKAAAIAYRNLTVYLNSNSDYADARSGSIQAAEDLYGAGSAEVIAVTDAWFAVGVGNAYGLVSYCNSQSVSSNYEWIGGVSIGNFSKTSGASKYTDFTGSIVNLSAGQTYSVSLTPNFSGSAYNEYWKIWIDYNTDGDFDDAGELVFDPGSASNTVVTGNLLTLPSATGATRMRVSMKYNVAPLGPCESFSYGEVEDYTVSFGANNDTIAPSTPINVSTTSVTSSSVAISWSSSTDNVAVSHYNVYNGSTMLSSPNNTTYSVSGLNPNSNYTFYVEAEDASGNKSPKGNVSFSTPNAPDTQIPSAPGNVTASNITSNSMDVTWVASTDNVGVTGYNVYRNYMKVGVAITNSYSITGLYPNTNYTIHIEAFDAAGNLSIAASTSAVTTNNADVTAPTTPGSLSTSGTTHDETTLSWAASTDNIGVTGYNVYQGTNLLGTTTSLSYQVTGLSGSTAYTFYVEAKDAAGNTSSQASAAVTTGQAPDMQAPTVPTGLTANNITFNNVDLSWNPSTDNVGVSGYNVYQGSTLLATTTSLIYSVSSGTTVTPNTAYSFYVEAFDAAGNHSGTSVVSVITPPAPDTQSPTDPSNIVFTNITQNSIDFAWTSSSDNVGVTGYNIYLNGLYQTQVSQVNASLSGLSAGTSYTVEVEAVDAAGNTSNKLAGNTTTANATPTTMSLFAHYFESGWDGWQDGGADVKRYSGNRSYEGTYSIRIQDNSGANSTMTSPAYDVSGYNTLDLEFYFFPNSMESNEKFHVKYYDGSSWNTLKTYTKGSDFQNDIFYSAKITFTTSSYNFPSDAKIAIECDASSNADRVYIDQISLAASNPTSFVEGGETIAQLEELYRDDNTYDPADELDVTLYPNPASDHLIIQTEEAVQRYRIYQSNGMLVEAGEIELDRKIDLSPYQQGSYFIQIESEDMVYIKKFMKL